MHLAVTARSPVCLIIGDPVSHSLSPVIHNAGYKAAGLPHIMVGAAVSSSDLEAALQGFRALRFRGLAVTMPHKKAIVHLLDAVDTVAAEIGAVNTVVNEGGRLIGYNTDWHGMLRPLERVTTLASKRVAVLGAGGVAQAAVFATTKRGAQVTVFNRTSEKAAELAERWGCEHKGLDELSLVPSFEIIINCTSIGMGPPFTDSPLASDLLAKHHIVFETIYSPHTTALVTHAEARGAQVIRGSEMFLEQALAQFELHTGTVAPRNTMERALRGAIEG